MPAKAHIQALLFDVFGTVVDWRGSLIDDLGRFGAGKGIAADWAAFADDWRALYQPTMEEVRSGRRAWTILDVLHRESLDALLAKYRITDLSEADKEHMNRVWHRLRPWPDAVPGLRRLKLRFIVGTLSNGNVGLLNDAKVSSFQEFGFGSRTLGVASRDWRRPTVGLRRSTLCA